MHDNFTLMFVCKHKSLLCINNYSLLQVPNKPLMHNSPSVWRKLSAFTKSCHYPAQHFGLYFLFFVCQSHDFCKNSRSPFKCFVFIFFVQPQKLQTQTHWISVRVLVKNMSHIMSVSSLIWIQFDNSLICPFYRGKHFSGGKTDLVNCLCTGSILLNKHYITCQD